MSTKPELCRICMASSAEPIELFPIFGNGASDNEITILDKLSAINIMISYNDKLPRGICNDCFYELDRAYKFKEKSVDSERILLSFYLENIDSDVKSGLNLKNEIFFVQQPENKFYEVAKSDALSEFLPEWSIKTEETDQLEVEERPPIEVQLKSETDDCNSTLMYKSSEVLLKRQHLNVEHEKVEPKQVGKKPKVEGQLKDEINHVWEKFKCKLCGREFSKNRYLNRHMLRHLKGQFDKPSKRHLLSMKSGDMPMIVPKETIDIPVEDSLKLVEPVIVNNAYSCAICGMCFSTVHTYKFHCNSFHGHAQNLNDDNLSQAAKKGPLFTCYYDGRGFTSRKLLSRHMQRMHINPKLKIHRCRRPMCEKSFSSFEQLNAHKLKFHENAILFPCDICGKNLTTAGGLKTHISSTHLNIRNHLCSECGKSFASKGSLQEHLNRHLPYKLFTCTICDHGFSSKGEHTAHMDSHAGLRPYICDYEGCTARYTRPYTLTKHKRVHTGEKPFPCDFCPMRFRERKGFVNHRRTHTGERPHKCSYCGKAFTQRFDMVLHTRIHTGEKPHVCSTCGMNFRQPSTLKTHMKVHRKVENVTQFAKNVAPTPIV